MFSLSRRIASSIASGVILVLLIVLACYVSIGRILVTNIDTFRTDIEAALSDALNIDVRVEGLRGDWAYLDPELHIDRLTIGKTESPAILIDNFSTRLDFVASVREGQPIVCELRIGGLVLTLSQDVEGAWYIEGLPRRGEGFNVDPLLSSIAYLREVNVTGVDVEVKGRQKHYHLTNQHDRPFILLADGSDKSLSMPLLFQPPDKDSRGFELLGRYRGDPRKPARFSADLYLQLPTIELADFVPVALSSTLRELSVEGEFWLNWNAGEFLFHALPKIDKVRIRHGNDDAVVFSNGSASLVASGKSLENIELYVRELSGMVGAVPWSLPELYVGIAGTMDDPAIAAYVPAVDIDQSVRVVLSLAGTADLIPESGRMTLASISPGGVLEDLVISKSPASLEQEVKVSARMVAVHMDSWGGLPSISSLNGFFSGSSASGHLDIHNDRFEIDFAKLFPEPWPFDFARGRIHYAISPGFVQVRSDLIELIDGKLRAGGRFHLNLPEDLASRTWGLEVGITDGDLVNSTRYLPHTLPGNLAEWLGRSVQGGVADTAGLLFHGPLGKEAPRPGKVYELFFDVKDSTLDYDEDWPAVQDLSAMIYIGNWGVESNNAQGVIYETEIAKGRVDVPAGFDEPADSILIHGELSGPLVDGIRVLTETPVADTINNTASQWQGEGSFTGSMSLDVPIGVRVGEPVGVNLNIELANNSIYMPDFHLDIGHLVGNLEYNNVTGLHADALSASVFSETVSARIETQQSNVDSAINIYVDGRIDMQALYDWSDQALLKRTSGVADYKAHVHIPFGGPVGSLSFVSVESSLEGVTIELPAPMGKDADEAMFLAYKQTFTEPEYTIDLELGDLTRASFRTSAGVITGGRFHFGDRALGDVNYEKLDVMGELEFVDYDEWELVMQFLEAQSDVSIESEMANRLSAIDLDVNFMKAFGLELRNVETYITRDPEHWNVSLTNQMLSGLIKVPDSKTRPLDISLSYLRFDSDESSDDQETAGDPLAAVLPTDLVALDFRLESLEIGGENYGAWSFNMHPTEQGVNLSGLTAEVKGLMVDTGADVIWEYSEEDGHLSKFIGSVKVPDLATALTQWGFASSIEGEKFHFDADITWPGSPAAIDIDTIEGLVHLRQGNGRFVQAESAGALKLLGIFDFASLARRFRFDFSDVVDDGLVFSQIKGSTRFNEGLVTIVSPIVIIGAGSTFKVGGSIDLRDNTLHNDMIVTLPVSRNLPWYAAYSAIATGPLAGAGVWLAQKIFEDQINTMTSAKYEISGTIDEPVIDFVSIFDDSVREDTVPPPAVKPKAKSGEKPTKESGVVTDQSADLESLSVPDPSQSNDLQLL